MSNKFKKYFSNNFYMLLAIIISISGTIIHALFGQSGMEYSAHAIGSDDAYISYRYAENLFNGHGLVFNAGEYVEGYSNLLYTLLLTPGFWGGKDFIYSFSIGINCVILAFCLFYYWTFTRKELGPILANFSVLLLALNPWIWVNASTGLETILILCATIGVWISIERYSKVNTSKNLILVFAFILISILSRVDGFILPIIAVLYLLIQKKFKDGLKIAFFICICLMTYTIFRIYYYDDIIANTFYNKVSGKLHLRLIRGIAFYNENSIKTGLGLALILGYFYLFKKSPEAPFSKRINFSILFLFVWTFYLIYIGGDIYYERFIVAIIPISVFTVFATIKYFNRSHLYVISIIMIAMPIYYASHDGRFEYSSNKYDMWVNLGKFLAINYPSKVIAIDAAGKVPFFSGLKTIDMLGLNDKHIGKMKTDNQGPPGHTKYDPEYVLSKQPALIAAWIGPELDMVWGVTKDRYLENYKLKFLVNSTRHDLGSKNIIDVEKLNSKEIKNLVNGMHNYGVLLRRQNSNDVDQISDLISNLQPNMLYSHTTNQMFFPGWSHPEVNHRWSVGSSSKIVFLSNDANVKFKGNLELNFETLGKQQITINLNGHEIFSENMDVRDAHIKVAFPTSKLINGINSLEFILPNARQPGKLDNRILALALKNIRLN